jgi:hypothetical protein
LVEEQLVPLVEVEAEPLIQLEEKSLAEQAARCRTYLCSGIRVPRFGRDSR